VRELSQPAKILAARGRLRRRRARGGDGLTYRGLSECMRRRRMQEEEWWMCVEESEDGKEDGRVRE